MTLLKVCSLLFMVALFSVRFLASNKDVQKKSEHCGEGSAPFTDDESRDPDLTDACCGFVGGLNVETEKVHGSSKVK
jgi:hypothetical protein